MYHRPKAAPDGLAVESTRHCLLSFDCGAEHVCNIEFHTILATLGAYLGSHWLRVAARADWSHYSDDQVFTCSLPHFLVAWTRANEPLSLGSILHLAPFVLEVPPPPAAETFAVVGIARKWQG